MKKFKTFLPFDQFDLIGSLPGEYDLIVTVANVPRELEKHVEPEKPVKPGKPLKKIVMKNIVKPALRKVVENKNKVLPRTLFVTNSYVALGTVLFCSGLLIRMKNKKK